MRNLVKNSPTATVIGLTLFMLTGNALADKPQWAEGHKEHRKYTSQQEKHDKKLEKAYKKNHNKHAHKKHDKHDSSDYSYHFPLKDRQLIYSYFGKQQHLGKCPPGLAKKNNGCLPPGQYKKWQKGKPLSRQVRYYELPRELRYQLSRLDDGYRYVRVDNDILLINLATHIVVDAIENILR